jgi:hypothetical protein
MGRGREMADKSVAELVLYAYQMCFGRRVVR